MPVGRAATKMLVLELSAHLQAATVQCSGHILTAVLFKGCLQQHQARPAKQPTQHASDTGQVQGQGHTASLKCCKRARQHERSQPAREPKLLDATAAKHPLAKQALLTPSMPAARNQQQTQHSPLYSHSMQNAHAIATCCGARYARSNPHTSNGAAVSISAHLSACAQRFSVQRPTSEHK